MIPQPKIAPRLVAMTLALLLSLSLGLALNAADAAKKEKSKTKPDKEAQLKEVDKFFTSAEVLRIKIEIPKKQIDELNKWSWQWGQSNTNRPKVLCTVREGSTVYTNVEVHLKGSAGSFRSVEENPAMTLNFHHAAKAQSFHGLEKLSLNNSVQDPTFVSEQFCREIFLKAGIPTPRATHAEVELNGRDLGLYVLLEGFNKQFVSHYFKNTKGNLYDGGFLKDVTDQLTTNSGDHPDDQSDLKALAEAAKEKDRTNRMARLEKVLDMDKFLTYLALDIMMWNWDGYALNRNNWRLYHDMDKDKMVFLPHGLDQMFWKPAGYIFPDASGLVAKAAFEIPAFQKGYLERMKLLRNTVFQPEAMTNRVRQIAAKIQPIIARHDPKDAKSHQRDLDQFCRQIVERCKNIDQQLLSVNDLVKFDQKGVASLSGWSAKTDFCTPVVEETKGPDSSKLLRIAALSGSSIGGFATQARLPEGKYVVEGKIKTTGVVADPGDPRGGASLRLGDRRSEKRLLGDNDWTPFKVDIDVTKFQASVDIVCELRAAKGEALFDANSLRIVKK